MENYWGINFQAEQNFGENIIVTQSWQKCAISSQLWCAKKLFEKLKNNTKLKKNNNAELKIIILS